MAGQKRQRKSVDAQRTVVALIAAAGRVRDFVSRVIEPHGITGQQYNVLRILRGAEPGGCPTLTVAERMIERAPGITRMIDRLEAKSLVERSTPAGDRRCVVCRITRKGLALLAELDEAVATANRESLLALDATERAELQRLAEKLLESHDESKTLPQHLI